MPQRITHAKQASELLSRRRKALGQTQREIASKLGITQGRLSALEGDAGPMTLDRFLALANLLGFAVVLEDQSSGSNETEW